MFRGIPFAEPPVGALRFAAPRPTGGWPGLREAVSFGPPPPQAGHFGMDALSQDDAGDDWMTLNVWSPEPSSSARLPVMVWIQGGAYVIGMSGLPEYDGALGACHGLDVPLVFGNLDGGQTAALIGAAPSPEARTLSDRMRAAWASFADHGDPGWPAYDRESRLVQVFADRPVVSAYPEEASRWIWQDYDFPALPFAGP